MTPEELIASGKIELYVYGVLPAEEHEEVFLMAAQHTVVKEEIMAIEAALYRLSSYTSPYLSARNYERIKTAIKLGGKNLHKPGNYLLTFMGYAAAVLFLLGMGYYYTGYNHLKGEYDSVTDKNKELETTVTQINTANQLLNEIRDSKYTRIALEGQAIAPEATAGIYWDKDSHKVLVDVQKLPEPPEGKVYQVWSLVLTPNPVPTSIGVLDDYKNTDTKIFEIDNVTYAEAFGITLEPKGGSKTPTMEQLYTLGKV